MNDAGWYEVAQGRTLLQGDLLSACPVLVLTGESKWPILPGSSVPAEVREVDLIVMTQSCDLENEKVADVLLAQVFPWPMTVKVEVQKGNRFIRSSQFRKQLVAGNVPGLSLLCKRDDEPKMEWSVVNFRHLYTLPKVFTQQFAATAGPRLRLRSPYREHLAQAFARYFMRVGLPHDAKAFEKEGDVQAP